MKNLLPALVLCLPSLTASAQTAGTVVTQIGWLHAQTHDGSNPLHTDVKAGLGSLIGIPDSFDSPGTSTSIGNADTLVIANSYFITGHLALKFEGGIPPTFDLYGRGVVQPNENLSALSVDLGAHRPLASSMQWSPALLFQYHFRPAAARWRPYAGVGVTYTWFTHVDLNNGFKDDLKNTFGVPLAVANLKSPSGIYVEANATPDWAPIANAGLSYAFSPRWGVSASVSYVGLSTESKIDIYAADGTRLAHSQTRISLNPVVTALVASYAF
ncbi:MAG: OmpW family outer membrane protein [Solimonas sp.]